MEFEWLNSEKAMPIGLKGNDCYFELTIFEHENKQYPLVSNMYGHDKVDLYELIVNVISNIEKKIEIKEIYQIIDNQTFEACRDANWKDITYEKNVFNNDYLMIKTDVNNFLELFRKVFNE